MQKIQFSVSVVISPNGRVVFTVLLLNTLEEDRFTILLLYPLGKDCVHDSAVEWFAVGLFTILMLYPAAVVFTRANFALKTTLSGQRQVPVDCRYRWKSVQFPVVLFRKPQATLFLCWVFWHLHFHPKKTTS